MSASVVNDAGRASQEEAGPTDDGGVPVVGKRPGRETRLHLGVTPWSSRLAGMLQNPVEQGMPWIATLFAEDYLLHRIGRHAGHQHYQITPSSLPHFVPLARDDDQHVTGSNVAGLAIHAHAAVAL